MTTETCDFKAAAMARVSTFERRGKDRNFLACWIPEKKLLTAFESAMRRHGDPERWWDMISADLDEQASGVTS